MHPLVMIAKNGGGELTEYNTSSILKNKLIQQFNISPMNTLTHCMIVSGALREKGHEKRDASCGPEEMSSTHGTENLKSVGRTSAGGHNRYKSTS